MYAPQPITVRTLKGVHFTGIIAQDESAQENLVPKGTDATNGVVPEGLAAGRHTRSRLKSIRITSKENLAWEVWLFGTNAFATANADTDRFIGFWTFAAADAKRTTLHGGALDTYFYYYIDGLDVVYHDTDMTGAIHIRLANRSVASKSAGAAGELTIALALEPTEGM
jgi:hypothetical protein